jgi:ABC-type amino acid transport substrate-binding protein
MVETSESIVDLYLNAVVTKNYKGGEITLANIKNFKLGITRGSKIAEGFVAKHGIEANVANTPQQLFQMANAGRIDVILLASATPLSDFPEFAASMIEQTKPLAEAKTVHVMGTKLAATHAAKWDATVRAMKADGRWAKLMRGI